MNGFSRWRPHTALVCTALSVAWSASASAAANFTCTATMTGLIFNDVDMVHGSGLQSNATLNYRCQNTGVALTRYARVCFSIGDGAQGAGNFNPRRLLSSSAQTLAFQMYKDGHTTIWGSKNNAIIPSPLEIVLDGVAPQEIRTGTHILAGIIPANQTNVTPDTFINEFTGGHKKISVASSTVSIPGDCGTANDGSFPFVARAIVPKTCKVSATDLDFGTVADPITASNIDAQNTVSVTCSKGIPYTVAMLPSSNDNNGAGRMSSLGAIPGNQDKVPYQLYRNSARTQAWGNQINVNTVGGVGTGTALTIPVYGRVPTTNFAADSYQDTVTVIVNY